MIVPFTECTMILALLLLPVLMLVYSLGKSTLVLVIAAAAIGYAYTDCVKSCILLAFEEDDGKLEESSRNARPRRHRRSSSPPPDLESISDCSHYSGAKEPSVAPETKTAQYPKAIPAQLRAENALLSRRRVRFACPRDCIYTY